MSEQDIQNAINLLEASCLTSDESFESLFSSLAGQFGLDLEQALAAISSAEPPTAPKFYVNQQLYDAIAADGYAMDNFIVLEPMDPLDF